MSEMDAENSGVGQAGYAPPLPPKGDYSGLGSNESKAGWVQKEPAELGTMGVVELDSERTGERGGRYELGG